MASEKYYMLEFLDLKPESAHETIAQMPKIEELAARFGAKICGKFMCVNGVPNELLLITEFSSLQAHADMVQKFYCDEEARKMAMTLGKNVASMRFFFTKNMTAFPLNFPAKDSNIYMRGYEYMGFVRDTVHPMRRLFEQSHEKYLKASGCNMIGLFFSLYGLRTNNIITLFEVPKGKTFDDMHCAIARAWHDEALSDDLRAMYKNITAHASRLYVPLP